MRTCLSCVVAIVLVSSCRVGTGQGWTRTTWLTRADIVNPFDQQAVARRNEGVRLENEMYLKWCREMSLHEENTNPYYDFGCHGDNLSPESCCDDD